MPGNALFAEYSSVARVWRKCIIDVSVADDFIRYRQLEASGGRVLESSERKIRDSESGGPVLTSISELLDGADGKRHATFTIHFDGRSHVQCSHLDQDRSPVECYVSDLHVAVVPVIHSKPAIAVT